MMVSRTGVPIFWIGALGALVAGDALAEDAGPTAIPYWMVGIQIESDKPSCPRCLKTPDPKESESARNPASTLPVSGDVKRPDKSQYTLFHPTPKELLRDFNPDRPGTTNTPATIDAGHVELELELFNLSYSSTNGMLSEQLNYPGLNLRIGITNSLEVQLSWLSAVSQLTGAASGPFQVTTGLGDVNLRMKMNFSGNEGGPFAWAGMLGLRIPTNTNNIGNKNWEPNLMVPLSFNVLTDLGISLMPEIDFKRNQLDGGYHLELSMPFAVAHHLFSVFDGYAELVSRFTSDSSASMSSYLGAGFSAKVAPEIQLDAGCNFGLSANVPQFNPFAGFSVRF